MPGSPLLSPEKPLPVQWWALAAKNTGLPELLVFSRNRARSFAERKREEAFRRVMEHPTTAVALALPEQ